MPPQSTPPNTESHASIGVLDSGVGGLSVLRAIHQALPDHPTVYFADQAHLPYGPRPLDEIRRFTSAITDFLLAKGAVVIVVACNAASAASLSYLREQYPNVPFVGMEPAVKPAAAASRTGVIGVLTTQATADGPLYERVLTRFADGVQVITQIAPELVHIVETNSQHTPENCALLRQYMQPFLDARADQIALACTHFPFLIPILCEIVGPDVVLVDPSPAIARQVARVWPPDVTPGHRPHTYFTSGDPDHLRAMLKRLIDIDAPVVDSVALPL